MAPHAACAVPSRAGEVAVRGMTGTARCSADILLRSALGPRHGNEGSVTGREQPNRSRLIDELAVDARPDVAGSLDGGIPGFGRCCFQRFRYPEVIPRYRTEDRVEIFASFLDTQFNTYPTTDAQHVATIKRHLETYFESPIARTEHPIVFSLGWTSPKDDSTN